MQFDIVSGARLNRLRLTLNIVLVLDLIAYKNTSKSI